MKVLKNLIRVCLFVLLGLWLLLVMNFTQSMGGAFCFTNEINQKGLFTFFLLAPALAYILCLLIVPASAKVWMFFAPILFWIVGFPLFGLTWGGLSSVTHKMSQWLALYDMELVQCEVIDAQCQVCTYHSVNQDWWPMHKLTIVRREYKLIPGLSWVRNVPQQSVEN